MDVSMSTALDLGSAPAAGGPVSAVLGTLDARGAWRVNGRSDVTRQPGAPLTRTSVRSRVAPPFRQHGFGMYATNADAPLMVVWLPPPAT
jgi:hypothetical protein